MYTTVCMCAMASSFFVLAVKIFFCLVIFSLGLQVAGFQLEVCWLFVSVTLLISSRYFFFQS